MEEGTCPSFKNEVGDERERVRSGLITRRQRRLGMALGGFWGENKSTKRGDGHPELTLTSAMILGGRKIRGQVKILSMGPIG